MTEISIAYDRYKLAYKDIVDESLRTYVLQSEKSQLIGADLISSIVEAGEVYCDLAAVELPQIVAALQDGSGSDKGLSEMSALQLQLLMDQRSKLLQAVSNIEKAISDTAAAIVQNMK
jgi:hypothetical protein